jgi:hypothetical protein
MGKYVNVIFFACILNVFLFSFRGKKNFFECFGLSAFRITVDSKSNRESDWLLGS